MEQNFIQDPTLIGALVIAIGTLVGALVAMWNYIKGKMTVIIEENTKSNMQVSKGLEKVSEAVKELKEVIQDNTRGFQEMEKSNLILSEQIKHI